MPRRTRRRRRARGRPEVPEDISKKQTSVLEVRVSGLGGKLCRFSVDGSRRVWEVKQTVAELTGIPCWSQSLLAGTQRLEKDATLLALASLGATGPSEGAAGDTQQGPGSPADGGGSGAAKKLELTLVRMPVAVAHNWKVQHNGCDAVLMHVRTGFIIRLWFDCGGWYEVDDGDGTACTIFNDNSSRDATLGEVYRLLAKEAKERPLESWLDSVEGSLQLGRWMLQLALEDGELQIDVHHALDGHVLRLGHSSLQTPRFLSTSSPAPARFQRALGRLTDS